MTPNLAMARFTMAVIGGVLCAMLGFLVGIMLGLSQ